MSSPTRVTPTSATILDQFISNCPSLISEVDVMTPIANCDHCPIRLTLRFKHKFNKQKSYDRFIWQYDKADLNDFKNRLHQAPWDDCFTSENIDEIADAWTSTFLNIAHEVIPNKTVVIRPGDKTFFTSDLRRLRRKKMRRHHKAKRFNTEDAWRKFRDVRNVYNSKIQEAKLAAEEKQINILKDKNYTKPKKWWQIAKSVLKKTKESSYPPLKVNDEDITDNKEKAEKFNEFFSTYSNIDTSAATLPAYTDHIEHSLSQIHITERDISDLIKNIDVSKATGPDLISPRMLKQAGDAIVPSLTKLFNLSLQIGRFPNSWKLAHVTPLFKKNDKTVIDNYRPVSLLSCTGKLLERAIFKYVFNYLRDHNIITMKQSGFIPGDSTTYQLVHLYHLFTQAIENQKDIRIVFCDISKAFDKVWHEGLLFKLKNIGISGPLLNWFKDYLNSRKQRVVINGQSSSWNSIKAGVPQGSVLGPLLFLIYINDITSVIQSEVRLFADDTVLYIDVEDPTACANLLNTDLANMTDWANQWLVQFSPPKTVTLNISKKRKKLHKPPLIMDNTVIKEVKSHKHLGVTLSHDLGWKEHIESICISANQCLDVLNAFKYKLDRATLERLYFSYVRSKLEYSNILWDNCTKFEKDLLESVQLRAAKIVSGAINRTSRELIYKELDLASLEERRLKQCLGTIYNT